MILITGGAGFIGSALAHELYARDPQNCKLIIVDRIGSKEHKWKNLLGLKFCEYVHADELFLPEKATLRSSVRAIYHLGACSDTTERNVDYLMKNNYYYSRAIWDWAMSVRIPLVYASSAATYGNGEFAYSDEESIDRYRPLNAYGYSKQVFDQWVLSKASATLFSMPWYGLKFFNVYGANEAHKGAMSSVAFKAHEQIVRGNGRVKLFKSQRSDFKDGEQLRDFIYVKDAVRAMILFMEQAAAAKPTVHSGIYNMGTGKARSFNDLVGAVFKALNLPTAIDYIDMPPEIASQYQYFTEATMNKFSRAFPDFKFTSLEDGISDYVQNHLKH
ncbi:MAG: ADP-glyceromanno-heptose 6-epimerase [Oligoflexia bacterium]|nr:ADP-glyceromanno-heptose 6-epimerase [Oligoflexia bacterium]